MTQQACLGVEEIGISPYVDLLWDIFFTNMNEYGWVVDLLVPTMWGPQTL